ncbi:MAG: twin-arginine translocase TatA/TatE family subunit [Rickettsiales bacterium]|nr:MAG: twin-arginine translocase TatA/TatE family subunit [Rickettsiales bacterium]
MGVSLVQLLVILLIILLLFGAGKLPRVMSELGKGLKSFKSSMNEDDSKDDSNDDNKNKKG